jgi:hypothetical protein
MFFVNYLFMHNMSLLPWPFGQSQYPRDIEWPPTPHTYIIQCIPPLGDHWVALDFQKELNLGPSLYNRADVEKCIKYFSNVCHKENMSFDLRIKHMQNIVTVKPGSFTTVEKTVEYAYLTAGQPTR